LRVLHSVIKTCDHMEKSVTLCGEMAGQPRAFVLLLGMGLRQFSMSPASIPRMKELAKLISIEDAEKMLLHCLELKTTAEVQRYMTQRMREIAADFSLLDTV
jgi:phosphotransferase system enzyme I (PtsI)